jgi:hypothetical protein
MVTANNVNFVKNSDIDEFIAASTSKERLKILLKWHDQSLKIDESFLRGLLKFPLTQDEVLAAFEICDTMRRAPFELWIMDNILTWDQNIAASAIRAWERTTDRILWHRLIPLASSPGLPQRVRFTILDVAPSSHGFEIVKATLLSKDWEELSPTFHALLFQRCLQFDLRDSRLDALAWKVLEHNKGVNFPEDKSLIAAIGWLCKHQEKALETWTNQAPKNLWISVLSSVLDTHGRRLNEISKIEKMVLKGKEHPISHCKLPALWSRGEFKAAIYSQMIQLPKTDSSLMDGIPAQIISSDDHRNLLHNSWVDVVIGRLPFN